MQSRWYTSLLLLLIVGSTVAAFGMWTIVIVPFLLAAVTYVRTAESAHAVLWKIVVAMSLGLVLLFLLTPIITGSREAARRMQCSNNLRQITLALHKYHDAYGCFPPAYLTDKDGKPMHSWRVLILPYLEPYEPADSLKALYKQYDFAEPWNGPNNSKLSAGRPSVYVCPSDASAGLKRQDATNYVAIVGPTTVWPGSTSTTYQDIRKGTSYTIMVVEMADSNINWLEPKDLAFDDACRGLASDKRPIISSQHSIENKGYFQQPVREATVAFADGHVCMVGDGISSDLLQWLLVREAAAKPIELESVDLGEGDITETLSPKMWKTLPPDLDWSNVPGLVFLTIATILFLCRPRGCQESLPQETPPDTVEGPQQDNSV